VESAWEKSSLVQEFILYKELPVLFARTTVDFHETRTVLKLRFPVNLNYCHVTAQAAYGYADRAFNGEEHPMHGWLDVVGAAPGRDGALAGLALLNDGKYSYDAHDRALYMTVLRSPFYANHTPFAVREGMPYPAIDQGIQRFTYALAPHLGPWQQTGMAKGAQLINQPPVVLPETFHQGPLPQSASFAEVTGEGVLLTSLKLAEDGSGDVIVHLDQVIRKACGAVLRLPILQREIPLELSSGQVLALRIPKDSTKPAVQVDFMEKPVY
jgi:alpha-mannosidase